ncbi:hypothetical protein [Alicyclobacillus sendaiensis]|uniref:Uncharacterized protein n=1 Tax=Alicyclobacillus sendaiensis PA2 TaxID=3029425 RepID=A0ABT6Y1V0_ALISE|nr:hypothetical protein [Alicyclobacillus sendaiensis]MDI9261305.1 hypothetical protein [Alicyclobacillus sendaiensis PA2]
MARPTALLRHLLILELIQAHIAREFARVKAQMREDGLHIIERQDGGMDIRIEFRVGDHYDEAVFMRKMLEAEAANRAKRTGMISR